MLENQKSLNQSLGSTSVWGAKCMILIGFYRVEERYYLNLAFADLHSDADEQYCFSMQWSHGASWKSFSKKKTTRKRHL